ncbi:class I SAM-dependent methyltransferase [Candidatus Chloroploca asiatica]|uniref:Methyltransferase type 11 domain-containing protein n=1 Tax=Candidatus Chloroploca asiatica TaxID=1506545 RepID=A0A2H3KQN5_9CHLR|nr:class I SAM-dependent methyltransferase [Candidatus Chloroploca asiatica]PDV97479.1 hypothetical protein A9Q02_18245 [Candidatus Chloroploca asiatica]
MVQPDLLTRESGPTSRPGALTMLRNGLCWSGGAACLASVIYWQVILAEGAYFGPRAVQLVYRFGARHYDRVRASWQPEADARLQPWLARALAGCDQPLVLDVATGTGRVPFLLASSQPYAGYLAALDLTPQMLRVARQKLEPYLHPAQILWHQGEASRLPWPSGSFDLVTCLEALEYFPQPRRALAEMVRVLRPGGWMLLSKIPDAWARYLPGRAMTHRQLVTLLTEFGCVDVHVLPWQPGHYELVIVHTKTDNFA